MCLVLAGAITVVTQRGKRRVIAPTGLVTLMCLNDECERIFELSQDEFSEEINKMGIPLEGGGTTMIICQECGQQSALRARTCQKCEAVFIPIPTQDDYHDRCPECGFSAIEDSRK